MEKMLGAGGIREGQSMLELSLMWFLTVRPFDWERDSAIDRTEASLAVTGLALVLSSSLSTDFEQMINLFLDNC